MNQQDRRSLSLYDLIARNWTLDSAIETGVFNNENTCVCFALQEGKLALISLEDAEPPHSRIRVEGDTGRSTISPREKPIGGAHITDPVSVTACKIAPFGTADFIVGCDDGTLNIIAPDGTSAPLTETLNGTVLALDHHQASHLTACASSSQVLIHGPNDFKARIDVKDGGHFTALSLSPDGKTIAISDQEGLALYDVQEPNTAQRRINFTGSPTSITWRQDQQWLLCPLEQDGCQLISLAEQRSTALSNYPSQVTKAVWSTPSNAFATSGAFRAAAWSMEAPPIDDEKAGALQTGSASLILVKQVAANPKNDFVAIGYENGLVLLAKFGMKDELLIHEEKASVTCLEWSSDGKQLLIAMEDGTAGVVNFPPQMFK